ncbi:MAG: sugar transferase [Verrucomicrobiaceae bacterium]
MNERGQKELFSTQALQVFDALLVWGSFALAAALRGPIRTIAGMEDVNQGGLTGMMWVIYIAVPLTPLVLEKFGFYQRISSRTLGESTNALIRGLLVVGLIVGMVAIFGKLTGTRRLILGSGFVLVFAALWLRNFVAIRVLSARAARPENLEHVVLAGDEEETGAFLASLDPEVARTWKIVERFNLESSSVDDLTALIKSESVQRVVFLTKHTEFERVARAVEVCEVQGVEAWIGASFMRTQVARPSFDVVGGQPMLVFRSTPELSWQLFAKSLIDFFGALTLVILTSPLWIAAVIGIRMTSPGGPVMFKQQRSGLYGKPFSIYKFRTMVPNAEALLDQVKEEHGNENDGPTFKLESDPRIFPFGAFLRKFSIDELPQMINVLKGEMSLVGPRPLPLHEIEAIENSAHRRRLSMKPGITCLWQISGRSDITSFDEWVKLDVAYIDKWSIWEDFRILFKTIPAVLFSKGAR